MMTDVIIPGSFDELCTENKTFGVSEVNCATSLSSNDYEDDIQGFLELISSDDEIPDVTGKLNDFIYFSINSFSGIDDNCKKSFISMMINILTRVTNLIGDNLTVHSKISCKKIMYYFQQLCIKAEKFMSSADVTVVESNKGTKTTAKGSKGKSNAAGFSWVEWRPACLRVMLAIVRSSLNKLWPMGITQENFLTGFWTYPLKLLEDRPVGVSGTGNAEASTRSLCTALIVQCAQQFSSPSTSGSFASLSAALLDAIMRHEHLCDSAVTICGKTQGGFVATEIFGEVSRLEVTALSSSGLRNIAAFIEKFASNNPFEFSRSFSILVKQLDSPAHQLRSAMLQAMGHVIRHVFVTSDTAGGELDIPCESAPRDGNSELSDADDGESIERSPGREPAAAAESEDRNPQQLMRHRDAFLDVMVERTHDINPYTRASVLKVWAALFDAGAVPVARIASVFELALDRLRDKNAGVRRNAVILLTSALDNNPFSASLDRLGFAAQYEQLSGAYYARVTELRKQCQSEPEIDDQSSLRTTVGEPSTPAAAEQCEEEVKSGDFERSEEVAADAQVTDIRAQLRYCRQVLAVIDMAEQAVPRATELLRSKTTSDVIEALRFFTRAVSFNVNGALQNFNNAFSLIWHQETAVKTELLTSFKNIYFGDGGDVDRASSLAPAEVALNLACLVQHCGESEGTSLERIVGTLFDEKVVGAAVVEALWEQIERYRVSGLLSSPSALSVATRLTLLGSSLTILSMISRCRPDVLTADKLATIACSAGLTEESLLSIDGAPDRSAMRAGLQCILATAPQFAPCSVSCTTDATVLSVLMETVPVLVHIIRGDICQNEEDEESTRAWFPLCEDAVHALFHFHPRADVVMARIVLHMYAAVSIAQSGGSAPCSVFRLSRFLFVLGQTGLCGLVFTELIAAHTKKFSAVAHVTEQSAQPATAADAMEEEMGTAAAADADHERILTHVTEQELVVRNLLGRFMPVVCFIVADDAGSFGHTLLRESSVLALCRCMTVSSQVCESCLPVLFTVLENTKIVSVRTTIMIALGDLAFRFPNLVEPWTDRMYAKLRDGSVEVRYNTLMVVTHLVLNDMIKVKGQVSHVAMSLCDPAEPVADLAKLFFIKLSERSNNPVYNLLGDIIGTFSRDGSEGNSADSIGGSTVSGTGLVLTTTQFRSVMHFLLSFVQKDKQADMLLERLLARMAMASETRQRRNLAFCISELTITDKGVRKMLEQVRAIKDALYDSEIFDAFRTTLARAKRGVSRGAAAAETKSAAEEFELFMESVRSSANGEQLAQASQGAVSLSDLGEEGGGLEDVGSELHETAPASKPLTGRGDTATASRRAAVKRGGAKAAAKSIVSRKKVTGPASSASEPDGQDDSSNDSDENVGRTVRRTAAAAGAAAPSKTRRGRAICESEED